MGCGVSGVGKLISGAKMSVNYREKIAQWAYKEFVDFDTIPPDSDVLAYTKALLICANGDGKLAPAEKNWGIGFTAAKGASDKII
ncbi:MAG: hypothetical protein F6J93_12815 [Oscillatoria sp. SIO1A7]|nr:hypothetical protein [Oscillatoria sp. SIO1A7]